MTGIERLIEIGQEYARIYDPVDPVPLHAAQAILMLIEANGGVMDEGPLAIMAQSIIDVAQGWVDSGLDSDEVCDLIAKTVVEQMPIPDEVYEAMCAYWETLDTV